MYNNLKHTTIPIYSILFAIYPALVLLGVNVSEVELSVGWRPIAVIIASVLLLLLLFKFILGDWHLSALYVSILILLFFTYGRVYSYLKTIEITNFSIGRHRYLLPLWAGLTIMGFWSVKSKVKKPQTWTPTLNLISLVMLLYPTFQIFRYLSSQTIATNEISEQKILTSKIELPLGYAPDIYYFILDAYGRADVLQDMFDYDNTSFLERLERKGFYIAECSQSNYSQSMLSITSSLNLNYLEELTKQIDPSTNNRAPLRALGQQNAARAFLDSQGYNTVSFATNFPSSEWTDADFFLSPPSIGMNEFEILLTETTLARVVMDFSTETPEKRTGEWYRKRTLFTLDQMRNKVPDIPGPKFVLVHLIIPHHPFVFGPGGEEVHEAISNVNSVPSFPIYKQGYSDQVTYINMQVEELIQSILETSSNPPIIIIQGDHGPESFGINENRMKILNAYYFPDGTNDLYPTITPVNSFRLIFNKYFSQDYNLLNDIATYSNYNLPYEYIEISNDCD